ncbi:MAG TPA: hypothetical protein VHW67_06965 [Solirubrobacteraceae bacterium]|jgi:pyruvate,orthophosphate dikinase|nr:hypothetical protein [Solirubrobacteraceae bacterium]
MSRFVHDLHGGPSGLSVLGELGAGLVGLQRLELAVPRGFVISTQAHRAAIEADGAMPAEVWEEIVVALLDLRSAPAEAQLATAGEGAAERSGPSYEHGMPPVAVRPSPPAHMCEAMPSFYCPAAETAASGETVAEDAGGVDRIRRAITAIWGAWEDPQVASQRDLRGISASAGTAIVVQIDVGAGADVSRGTIFTRDPESGSPEPVGRLVADPPEPPASDTDRRELDRPSVRLSALRQQLTRERYRQLAGAIPLIEASRREVCAIDFVVDPAQLWFVGIRQAERSGEAAVRVAVDMANEGMISREEALTRVPLSALLQLQAPIAARELERSSAAGEARLVPAQPDIHTTQLLDWCDERRRLRVAGAVPDGWTLASSSEQIAGSGAARLLLDIAALQAEQAPLWESLATAALAPAIELGVQLAELPHGGDLVLPPGPWTLVVAEPTRTWAARLLSARTTRSASPGDTALGALERD